jgi:hypothetical protein
VPAADADFLMVSDRKRQANARQLPACRHSHADTDRRARQRGIQLPGCMNSIAEPSGPTA